MQEMGARRERLELKHLVAEASRTRMNHDRDLAMLQPQRRGHFGVVNRLDDLHLGEMIARAQRAALIAPALVRLV